MNRLLLFPLLSMLVLLPPMARAELVRMEVSDRRDVLGGRSFGTAGAYEYVRGRAYFAVDPKLAANGRVVDLALAPRNGEGRVEFSADVVMLRPKVAEKGNGTLVVEAPNRGGMGMLAMYNRAKGSQRPEQAAEFGDGFLMREGYTLAWVGWQHDVPARPELLRAYVPLAVGATGIVRGEFTPMAATRRIPLGDGGHAAYPVGDPAKLTLTVRQGIYGERSRIGAAEWRLEGDEIVLGQLAKPGWTYEFLYPGKDPAVAGLGLAALRDFVAHLKGSAGIRYALGVGTSQSAMALKALVYEGFNADEKGRRVFDGLQPHVAGGRRSTFERFAQPSRTAGPYRNASLSTTDQFPYSDAEDTEPVTGRRDSLLRRSREAGVAPKILYTNSSYEYWGSAGALVHLSMDGKRDLKLPETTRVYLLAGGQHGPAAFPPKASTGQNLPNFNDYKWVLRALLTDLHAWVREDVAPPASRYPKLADGTLGPGEPPAHRTRYLNFGPEYLSKGIARQQPPQAGADYPVLAPAPDESGNDRAGVKMPWVSVPLGAFTGWNLRTAAVGSAGELLGQTGSFLPFPRERMVSLYRDREEYMKRMRAAAGALVQERLLRAEDVESVVETGGRIWDWATAAPGEASAKR